jgi:organic hydroperoxide reductase OsmC/OhrA
MSEHRASVHWERASTDFTYDSYNRSHEVRFKNDRVRLQASAAPAFKGDGVGVDPEEMFVASLSSCHMLTFLALCARKRLAVDRYEDDAEGHLEKGANGKLWMARVTLRPSVTFAPGVAVYPATLEDLHARAHHDCFIANSVTTVVSVETQQPPAR